MKTRIPLAAVLLTATLFGHVLMAQEPPVASVSNESASAEESSASGESAVDGDSPEAAVPEGRTFIPGLLEVTPFTPPPPPVVKRLPAMRIDSSITRRNPDDTVLTLQRGEPSTEPDLPPPPPPPPLVEPREPTPEEIALRIWQHRHTLNLGATLYDHEISVVKWTDPESRVPYEAVCGFDIGLLAGVGTFVHNGERYSLMLMHSYDDTTAKRRFPNYRRAPIPDVAPGEIMILKGDVTDTAATSPMTIIKDVITAEQERLIAYQAARDAYFKAFAAWRAAHPPVPRDETIILRPHRGSRYLLKR